MAILTPFAFPWVGGNATTVGRITRGLRTRGVDVRVWDLSAVLEPVVELQMAQFSPRLIHAFHALRAGPVARRLARRIEMPLLVTMTGTDANSDLFEPVAGPTVRQVLEDAAAVTVFHDSMAAKLAAAVPDLAPRLVVIPQSVTFENAIGRQSPIGLIRRTHPVLLFPAGIRKVKRPSFPLEPLERLLPRFPTLELLYAGPVLEADEGDELFRLLRSRPWAHYLGILAHDRMPRLLQDADVILNCSLSEGGMANSVLEALAMGRPVLAADIDGNRSVVKDGVTGLLFRTPGEFAAKAARLLADPDLRQRLGDAGREFVHAHLPPAQEVEGYLAAYSRLVPILDWGKSA